MKYKCYYRPSEDRCVTHAAAAAGTVADVAWALACESPVSGYHTPCFAETVHPQS